MDDIQELVKRLPGYAAGFQNLRHLQDDYRRFNLPPNVREVIDNNIQGLVKTLTAQLEQTYLFNRSVRACPALFTCPCAHLLFLRDEAYLKQLIYALFRATTGKRLWRGG